MINKQFLYYTDYDKFQLALRNGDINNNSIVFIANENQKLIWTQGNVFTDSKTFNDYIKTSDHNLDINGIQDQIGDYFKDNDKTISDVCSDLQDQIDRHTGRIEDVEEGVGQINDSLLDYAKTADVASDYATKSSINGRIDVANELFQDIDKTEPAVIKETLYLNTYIPGEYIYLQPLHVENFLETTEVDGMTQVTLKTKKWYYADVDLTLKVEEITDGFGMTGYDYAIIMNRGALDENNLLPKTEYYKLLGQAGSGVGVIRQEEVLLKGYINNAPSIFSDANGNWVLLIVQIGDGDNFVDKIIAPVF